MGGPVFLIPLYQPRGLCVVRGRGQYVWDESGRRYLDFHTGHGAAFLGHGNPVVVAEIRRQLEEIAVLTPAFDTPARRRALRALSEIAPEGLSAAYLLNSGSEAVEMALKIAKAYTGRRKILAFRGAFHGRTIGALSVTWNPRYREPFGQLLPDVVFAPFNDVSSADLVDEETAAVIVEPVQGEAGVVPASRDFLVELEKSCRSSGALLIVDEVQCGFGRTGRLWAFAEGGIAPDVLIAGKSLGGGFPVSVVMVRPKLVEGLPEGWHGSTFGGNPLACAAVSAGVRVYREEGVAARAAEAGKLFRDLLDELLSGIKAVREVRVKGLMIGVELRFRPGRVLRCLQEKGLLALKAGATTVRFLPPYLVTREDVEWSVSVLRDCIVGEA